MYLPRINKAHAEFKGGWNNHNIRTAHGKKLPTNYNYTEGVLTLQRSGLTAVDLFNSVQLCCDTDGRDEEGLSSTTSVPCASSTIPINYYADLVQVINPLHGSGNLAIELYRETLEFLDGVVSRYPTLYTS